MKAIVDCNSFYCSCEQVFRPDLKGRPIVVLSNNDGCIISQNLEAKATGIQDLSPYHEAKTLIQQHNVAVFSSNYNLYSNMSWRVMEILRHLVGKDHVEVYSVDEAFLNIQHIPVAELTSFAAQVKAVLEQWTGVKVSIGIAPTKTLAKIANRLAKKIRRERGYVVLDTQEKIIAALQNTKIYDIWGVGRRYTEKLASLNIDTAWDLYAMPEGWVQKNMGGVTGIRLHRELHSQEAVVMEQFKSKKMIATTRMFGRPVSHLKAVKEAIATYTALAAQKLRRQHSAATMLQVFVVEKDSDSASPSQRGIMVSRHITLPYATCLTNELIKPALRLAESLFEDNKRYKKAGVMLAGLVPDSSIQANLFEEGKSIGRFLMERIDNINFSMRGDVVKFAASGTSQDWKMRQEQLSPRYTMRWEELREVK